MQVSRDNLMNVPVGDVEISEGRRPADSDVVKRLAASIREIGLQHPITVRARDSKFVLVAGRHRLEAARLLGEEYIRAAVVRCSDVDARLWEIAENLHRAELSVQERSDQIAEWVRLTDEKVKAQVAPLPSRGRPNQGINAASRDLGVDRTEAQRAVKIASMTPEAKQAAQAAGLSDNQSALLQIARAPAEEQTARIAEIAARHRRGFHTEVDLVERGYDRLRDAWERADSKARERFLAEIGADQRIAWLNEHRHEGRAV